MNRFEFYSNLQTYKSNEELSHYGIIGQKWGQRRWQNSDGTFNAEGKERYFGSNDKKDSKLEKKMAKMTKKASKMFNVMYDNIDPETIKKQQDFMNNFTLNVNVTNKEKVGSMSDKEIKRLAKEAKHLEKDFMTKSKYDGHKYIDSDKVDEWLDKDERNKKVEESYEQIMNKAYGEKSKQIQEMFKDYDEDNERYVSEAGMNQAINFGNNTMGDISWNAKWFIGDDGDQANGNSHAYYLAKKGYNFKQINEMFNEADKAYEEGKEVGHKISQYSNPVILQMSDKVQERIYDRISSRYNKKDGYTWGKLGEASEGGYEKDGSFDKNVMKDVDNISKKLKSSCGNKNSNGWWYFNEAVDNLGMGNINYKDMTQSDWNRLNDEINRLKSK